MNLFGCFFIGNRKKILREYLYIAIENSLEEIAKKAEAAEAFEKYKKKTKSPKKGKTDEACKALQ